jgi:glutathione S-transferase
LRYHNIEFSEIKIPLYQTDSKQKLFNYSPAGKVPILLDDEIRVWESLAILEYLADRFPETRAWPEDVAEKALARSLAAEMHSGFSHLRQQCGMNCRRVPTPIALTVPVQADIERIVQIWEQCRQRFGQSGPWLFGRFSIVDAMYAPIALRFYSFAINISPLALAYQSTVLEIPAVKEWVAAGIVEEEVISAFE